jgi:hypothetical protein
MTISCPGGRLSIENVENDRHPPDVKASVLIMARRGTAVRVFSPFIMRS